MGKVSAPEMKRIITAIKRRDPLTDASWSLFHRPHRRIHTGPDEAAIRRSLEEAGLDFDEIKQINNTLRRKQMERLRARERRSVGNKQSIAEAKKLLRRWVEERRRSAKQLPPFRPPALPTTVFLNTPFLIWANPPSGLIDSKAEARNSTAQFGVDYFDEIPTEDHNAFTWVIFYFLWENDSDSTKVVVSTQTNLFVKGHGDCYARAGYIPVWDVAYCDFDWDASFRIMFWEGGSGTDVPYQASQRVHIANLGALDAAQPYWPIFPFFKGDRNLIDVSQQYPLAYSNLIVPPGQLILFAVSLHVRSELDGGGWCNSLFWGDYGFVACPFVELQIAA
jgi:hypothetical protein